MVWGAHAKYAACPVFVTVEPIEVDFYAGLGEWFLVEDEAIAARLGLDASVRSGVLLAAPSVAVAVQAVGVHADDEDADRLQR